MIQHRREGEELTFEEEGVEDGGGAKVHCSHSSGRRPCGNCQSAKDGTIGNGVLYGGSVGGVASEEGGVEDVVCVGAPGIVVGREIRACEVVVIGCVDAGGGIKGTTDPVSSCTIEACPSSWSQ